MTMSNKSTDRSMRTLLRRWSRSCTALPGTTVRRPIQYYTILLLLCSVLSGCGSEEIRGRIVGTVTLQGEPVSEGIVLFTDETQGVYMTARLQPDGSYEVVTADGAGLRLGTYRVSVGPPPPEPLMPGKYGEPEPIKTNIPQKYRDHKTLA